MIERMLASGGITVGESYEMQENGKTITVRSIGPFRERSEPDREAAAKRQLQEIGGTSRLPNER
ncbi:hypothetical protein [Novipirellula caenicola]|uniref:SPOR domain-containing protein n=1 Tax=Novipirellula caenicola TaxID=1536901 RepID=A0ABP9W2W7_9BACT